MRAIVKTRPGPGLEMTDVQEPDCGPLDVRIRVARTGLCGTDLHLQAWDDWAASTVRAPLVLGHEFSGTVIEVGRDVEGLLPVVGGDVVCLLYTSPSPRD